MRGAWRWTACAGALLLLALGLGWWVGSTPPLPDHRPRYSYGYVSPELYTRALARVEPRLDAQPIAGLVAHHLLIASDIAQVWEELAARIPSDATIVLVSPNHFSRGFSPAQVSLGVWQTPFGELATDPRAAQTLLDGIPFLRHEEYAAPQEHGIGGETPFIRMLFPRARFVPIMLDESLSSAQAWELGERIAALLPDAILVASIDMVHGQPAEETAREDARILNAFAHFSDCVDVACVGPFTIDSNASLRALWAFAHARGAQEFLLTHHGSSLAMGATENPEDNVSHILGLFVQ